MKSNLNQHGSFSISRPKTYNKENREIDEINVLASVETQPVNSCRKIEDSVGVNKSRVQKILQKHKFKPYKFHIVQNLHPGDAQRRLEFCNWYLENVNRKNNFERTIIWSDEAHFTSAGILNRQNTRFWCQDNQHVIFPRQQQGRFGFNVSCFILGSKIIYNIFEGSLTANKYLEILQNIVPEIIEDVPLVRLNNLYLQQDGAPAHNAHIVRAYLTANFRDRWIGTYGPVRWPPRSPDLSVLDFFLWGYLQNKIYSVRHQNMADLRIATERAFRELQARPFIILNALRRISTMCGSCIRHNGGQFEQYL